MSFVVIVSLSDSRPVKETLKLAYVTWSVNERSESDYVKKRLHESRTDKIKLLVERSIVSLTVIKVRGTLL